MVGGKLGVWLSECYIVLTVERTKLNLLKSLVFLSTTLSLPAKPQPSIRTGLACQLRLAVHSYRTARGMQGFWRQLSVFKEPYLAFLIQGYQHPVTAAKLSVELSREASLPVSGKSWFLHGLDRIFPRSLLKKHTKNLHGQYDRRKMLSVLWPFQQTSSLRPRPTAHPQTSPDFISKRLPGALLSMERPPLGSLLPGVLGLGLNLPSLQGTTQQEALRASKHSTGEKWTTSLSSTLFEKTLTAFPGTLG